MRRRRRALAEALEAAAVEAKLSGFEKIDVHVEPRPFDADRGLMTPTFKPKRKALQKHYQRRLTPSTMVWTRRRPKRAGYPCGGRERKEGP